MKTGSGVPPTATAKIDEIFRSVIPPTTLKGRVSGKPKYHNGVAATAIAARALVPSDSANPVADACALAGVTAAVATASGLVAGIAEFARVATWVVTAACNWMAANSARAITGSLRSGCVITKLSATTDAEANATALRQRPPTRIAILKFPPKRCHLLPE